MIMCVQLEMMDLNAIQLAGQVRVMFKRQRAHASTHQARILSGKIVIGCVREEIMAYLAQPILRHAPLAEIVLLAYVLKEEVGWHVKVRV